MAAEGTTMTALPISRLICSHDFYWSRKRQADVCRRCGALSPVLALHFRSKTSWTVGADLPPERGNGFEALPALSAPSAPVAAPEPPAQITAFVAEPAEPAEAPAPEIFAPEVLAPEILAPEPAFDIPAPVETPPTPAAQIMIVELTPSAEPEPTRAAPEPEKTEPEVFEVETFASDPFSRPIFSRALTDFSGRDAAPLLRPLFT